MRLVWAIVEAVVRESEDLQSLRVALPNGEELPNVAICYPDVTGRCAEGERVLLNVTAVDLGLGTGSVHFVAAREGRAGEPLLDDPSGGHIMKLRYTPLQRDVLAAEEASSPHHVVMSSAETLEGMPVVCCGLHSQVPIIAAAIKERQPEAKIAYVMTDQAALPMAFSDLVRACRAAGLIDATLTCGQAFGGEIEAVNLHSALLAARHVAHADVAVVAIGPGVVGTSTPFGHGGVAQGEAINAAAVLCARPVAVLRLSFADARPRHTPVSHHTLTALGRVALAPATVAVPALPAEQAAAVERALDGAGVWQRHERRDASANTAGLPEMRGVKVRTMGRSFSDDPAFFAAAAAAGEVAAEMLQG